MAVPGLACLYLDDEFPALHLGGIHHAGCPRRALRETSVLFAIALAHFFLHEVIGRYHIAAAGLAFAGILAIRIG